MKGIAQELKASADQAYCDYAAQMQRPACLGAVHKLRNGTFSLLELDSHVAAATMLGRHQAFAEAALRVTTEQQA